ncbi:hypothetical protein EJB05_06359 [Eragrostis curvula]|uniref:NB-ARC domain-containing protein n=1 Tax=Eragrostis curvula TaxID=38414 RepID=A0A5J9WFR2_9POAL|nr:hypothetical protein EJB05_06359 [Eragrostis curvula]
MTELVVTAVLKPLLGKLAMLLGNEYNLLVGVRGDVEFLQRELSSMDVLLREKKHCGGGDYWMIKLKDMVCDIEDGIDDFMRRLGSGDEKDGFIRDIVKQLKLKERHEIAEKLHELRSLIEEEGARRMRYGGDGSSTSVAVQNTTKSKTDLDREAALYVGAPHQLVGMNGPVEKIVDLLTLDENATAQQLQIVSIHGPGGLGKTTLAHQVHSKIQGQFDYTALVSVSQRASHANIEEILMKIAPVAGTSAGTMDRWQLINNAKNYLQDKRYAYKPIRLDYSCQRYSHALNIVDCSLERHRVELERRLKVELIYGGSDLAGMQDKTRYFIVFDDIWDSDIWEVLKSALPMNGNHSRVITTTRIFEVAKSCSSQSYHIHKMEPLNEDHSKELFTKRIFGTKRRCPKTLDELANQILKKCGGIPLAIITIGGLLVRNPAKKKEWKEVLNSLGNSDAHELEGMNKILSLSFSDLPYDLRNCFFYLSIFPEDCEINRERLVLRWISEGFICGKNENQKELRKVGEKYFYELVNRSLIQPVDIQYNGLPQACRVHDLMLSLIVSLAEKEHSIIVLDDRECPSVRNKIRWLSMHTDKHALMKVVTDNQRYVRSLSLFPSIKQLPAFSDFQALRVLDAKGCHFAEHQKWKYLRSLIHLKYLDLSDTNVTELPKEIGNLQCLETLDLRHCPIKSLPSTLLDLHKLVRLFVSRGVILPDRIGNMLALEEISHVAILCNSSEFVEQLGSLSKLRVLRVDGRYSWYGSKNQIGPRHVDIKKFLLPSLCKLGRNNLKSLEIDLPDDSLVPSILDSCCGLEELIISNFISSVPKCMRLLEDLSYLDIKLDEIEAEDLDVLSYMSASLEFLRLHLSTSPYERLVIDTEGFLSLKHFEFCCDDGGMGLEFAEEAMPELKRLDLEIGVRKTMSKYDSFDFGIKNLGALVHVNVKLDCNYAERQEIKAAEIAITSGVRARRIVPQIQKIEEFYNTGCIYKLVFCIEGPDRFVNEQCKLCWHLKITRFFLHNTCLAGFARQPGRILDGPWPSLGQGATDCIKDEDNRLILEVSETVFQIAG